MKERRPLKEGLKPVAEIDPSVELDFVYSSKTKPPSAEKPAVATEAREGKGTPKSVGRSPLTVRFRADFATALKRASLERQLAGVDPYHLQDILEQAVEPWLRTNGYLD